MKSVSPWTEACRFLSAVDTFPISASNPLGLSEGDAAWVLVPSEPAVVPIMLLLISLYIYVEWSEDLAQNRGRFSSHSLLHPFQGFGSS